MSEHQFFSTVITIFCAFVGYKVTGMMLEGGVEPLIAFIVSTFDCVIIKFIIQNSRPTDEEIAAKSERRQKIYRYYVEIADTEIARSKRNLNYRKYGCAMVSLVPVVCLIVVVIKAMI